MLGSEENQTEIQKSGARLCPHAPCIARNIDFQIFQAFDSVVVSTEVSPLGVINLLWHCSSACIRLLTKGIMCRGYIKKGLIHHRGSEVYGSAHVDAVAKEKTVSFHKESADERGTPFIEVD